MAERRFGDCKDKARLLCALLEELGVAAHPALVNTGAREHLEERLPSPLAFNHVIVGADLDGTDVYVDPTYTCQRGQKVADLFLADYGRVLPIVPGTRGLRPFAGLSRTATQTRITELYTLPETGLTARLDVETRLTGLAAESMRQLLAETRPDQLAKRYINYYAAQLPHIQSASPLAIRDDATNNLIEIKESYRLGEVGTLRADGMGRELFIPTEVREHLRRPATVLRTMPLAVAHPVKVSQSTTIRHPPGWNIPAEDRRLDSAAMGFHRHVSVSGDALQISYEYESRRSWLDQTEVSQHLRQVNAASDLLGYTIVLGAGTSAASPGGAGLNGPVLAYILAITLISIGGVAWLYRWRPARVLVGYANPDRALTGLGGWLVLVGISLFVTVGRNAFGLRGDLLPMLDRAKWLFLTTPGTTSYSPLWAPALLGSVALDIVLLFYSGLLIVLFFQRRTTFPRLMIILLATLAVTSPLLDVLVGHLPIAVDALAKLQAEHRSMMAQDITRALIWIPYFLRSQRVRNTFRWGVRLPPGLSARLPALPEL